MATSTGATLTGNFRGTGITLTIPSIPRSDLEQDDLKVYPLDMTNARVWDAVQTVLPNPSATDDLGFYTGVYGTGTPYIATSDLKAAGATSRYARIQAQLPAEYVDGETVTLRISGGMLTTVADTTATVDVQCYLSGRDTTIDGADICATAAQSINSLTFADLDFTITPTGVAAGDILDIRITVAVNDAATGTAVIGAIGAIELLCDVKG